MPTPNELTLGIKNYRKEWSGLVQTLTNVPIINPIIDNLDNVETFNKRFQQLAQSIRHAFNAAGDLAIRDKRYLESFLTGYTNPLVTESFSYKDPAIYTNIPTFDLNGNPVNFTTPHVMYNVSTLGSFSTSANYAWVFKNGLLVEEGNYRILNTAYGLKCFVKAELVTANDRIDIVINRIFNPHKNTSIKEVVIPASVPDNTSHIITFPSSELGTFYHTDYIKIYKKGTASNAPIQLMDKTTYSIESDTTGNNIKIVIPNATARTLLRHKLIICNTIFYYKNIIKGTHTQWRRDIELAETIGGVHRPIPFLTAYDFDVFYNGWKMEAGRHYTVLDNDTVSGMPIMRLHCTPPSGNFTLAIYKNEATSNRDALVHTEPSLKPKGMVIRYDRMESIPFMARLGNCFIASKYVPNSWLRVLQRNVLQVNPSKTKGIKDFFYQTRIVYTLDIKEILEVSRRHISEFDQVMNLFEESKILAQFATDRDSGFINRDITVDESYYNKPFERLYNNDTFVHLSKSSGDGDAITNHISNRPTNSRFVMNTNDRLVDHEEIANSFSGNLLIDTNAVAIEREIINVNNVISNFSRV